MSRVSRQSSVSAAGGLPRDVEGFKIGGRAPATGRGKRRRVRPLEPIPEEVWGLETMRAALRVREIATMYDILQRHGVSQRRIAAATGQSQSEISEILSGRRVWSYDVLVRIADGFGIPRGWMGLAHADTDPPPSEIELEVARIDALPFPAEIRVAVLRAFISGLTLAGALPQELAAP